MGDEATKLFEKYKDKDLSNAIKQTIDHKKFDNFVKKNKLADESLIAFLNDANYRTKDLANYQQYLKDSQGRLTGFSGVLSKAQGVLKGFGAALGSMGINWAIGEVIGFAANAIDDYISSCRKNKGSCRTIKICNRQLKSNFNSLKSTVNDSSQRFAELAQGVDNLGKSNQSRGNLSTEQYKEFLGLSNQLADLFPRLTTGYDENGNAILNLSGNIDTIVSSLNSLTEAEQIAANQDILKEMPNVWAGFSVDTSQ